MNILVTGGAGFIGSHLCDGLIALGHRVTAIDNLLLGREENIAHLCAHPAFNFAKGDVLDAPLLERVFADGRFDAVFHLAANSDIQRGGKDPVVDCELTFLTTFRVLQSMKKHGTGQLVFASTSAVYGETSDRLTEDYGPLLPVSNYGAGKLASEAFISAFSAGCGIRAWITRFPNVVGERATHGVIFDFIRKLQNNPARLEVLGNGKQVKPYMYVKDLVRGILFVWQHSSERLNVYNLGVETRTTVSDIARTVIEEMGLDAAIDYTGGDRGWVGDVPEFSYDLTKVHRLGWHAQYTSDEAVRLAVAVAVGSSSSPIHNS
jgi:UDP-glucose 4-epimerase